MDDTLKELIGDLFALEEEKVTRLQQISSIEDEIIVAREKIYQVLRSPSRTLKGMTIKLIDEGEEGE